MGCVYLGKNRCALKDGGEEKYEKYKEYCNSDNFSKCPWIKECMSKEEYARFKMMGGFFK
jgi:hypothetical protein